MPIVVALTLLFGANPYLPNARAAVSEMQYGRARQQLDLAMAVTTSTRDEKRELAQLSALVWAAEGKLGQAELAWEALLAVDPSAPAPRDGPPRVREAFRRVKERLYPPRFVGLVDRPAPPGRVAVAVTDPWSLVSKLSLIQGELEGRMAIDESGFASASLTPGARSWFVEARDAQGSMLAQLGTREAPRLLAMPEPVPGVATATPAGRSRVFPVVFTAVAAGLAVTAGVFAAVGADASTRAGTAAFASETRALDLQARTAFTATWGFGIGAALTGATAVVLWAW